MLLKCPNPNCGWEATCIEEARWREYHPFCPLCGKRMVEVELEIVENTYVHDPVSGPLRGVKYFKFEGDPIELAPQLVRNQEPFYLGLDYAAGGSSSAFPSIEKVPLSWGKYWWVYPPEMVGLTIFCIYEKTVNCGRGEWCAYGRTGTVRLVTKVGYVLLPEGKVRKITRAPPRKSDEGVFCIECVGNRAADLKGSMQKNIGKYVVQRGDR